jgi:hypothetical protein
MEPNDLLAKAWEAVEKSGVPESLQETAFKEAVAYLRSGEGADEGDGAWRDAGRRSTTRRSPKAKPTRTASEPAAGAVDPPDEDSFFEDLANESGVDEQDLRDILQLTSDGRVQVTQPTKDLGKNTAEQARTVVALVASARAVGLNERPVNAETVRREVERKRCFDRPNFASKVLGKLKGFNAGSTRNEIVTNSKWLDEFTAAVNQAHGRTSAAALES